MEFTSLAIPIQNAEMVGRRLESQREGDVEVRWIRSESRILKENVEGGCEGIVAYSLTYRDGLSALSLALNLRSSIPLPSHPPRM